MVKEATLDSFCRRSSPVGVGEIVGGFALISAPVVQVAAALW